MSSWERLQSSFRYLGKKSLSQHIKGNLVDIHTYCQLLEYLIVAEGEAVQVIDSHLDFCYMPKHLLKSVRKKWNQLWMNYSLILPWVLSTVQRLSKQQAPTRQTYL